MAALKTLQAESQYDVQRGAFVTQAFFPIVSITKEKLNDYLRYPPPGVEALQWEQVTTCINKHCLTVVRRKRRIRTQRS